MVHFLFVSAFPNEQNYPGQQKVMRNLKLDKDLRTSGSGAKRKISIIKCSFYLLFFLLFNLPCPADTATT